MRNKRKSNRYAPSPKSDKRACLCPDGTYSRKCCDGSFQAQGIGSIEKVPEWKYNRLIYNLLYIVWKQ